MSRPCQNHEINFINRDMQKTYYDQAPAYQGYYPGSAANGYGGYEAQMYPPQADAYRSSCLMQGAMPPGGTCGPLDYGQPYPPPQACMQGVPNPYGQPGSPGAQGQPGNHHPPPPPGIKTEPQSGHEIFPWMRENRQNSKHKQQLTTIPGVEGEPPSKRARTAYTSAQLVELEKEFHFNRYLCRPRRIEMAALLNLTERQIKIWFQNRRMKYKKDSRGKPGLDSTFGLLGGTDQSQRSPGDEDSSGSASIDEPGSVGSQSFMQQQPHSVPPQQHLQQQQHHQQQGQHHQPQGQQQHSQGHPRTSPMHSPPIMPVHSQHQALQPVPPPPGMKTQPMQSPPLGQSPPLMPQHRQSPLTMVPTSCSSPNPQPLALTSRSPLEHQQHPISQSLPPPPPLSRSPMDHRSPIDHRSMEHHSSMEHRSPMDHLSSMEQRSMMDPRLPHPPPLSHHYSPPGMGMNIHGMALPISLPARSAPQSSSAMCAPNNAGAYTQGNHYSAPKLTHL